MTSWINVRKANAGPGEPTTVKFFDNVAMNLGAMFSGLDGRKVLSADVHTADDVTFRVFRNGVIDQGTGDGHFHEGKWDVEKVLKSAERLDDVHGWLKDMREAALSCGAAEVAKAYERVLFYIETGNSPIENPKTFKLFRRNCRKEDRL